MAGSVKHIKTGIAKFENLILFKVFFRHNHLANVKPKQTAMFRRCFQKNLSGFVYNRFQAISFVNEIIAQYMINMGVGVDQCNRFKPFIFYILRQFQFFFSRIATGVNDCTFAGFIVKQISVFLEWIEYKNFDTDHTL